MSANQPNQEQPKLEEKKITKQAIVEPKKSTKVESKQAGLDSNSDSHQAVVVPKVRLIPIWLRLVILVCMIVISVIAGALVGYGALGGGKATDVLKESTWTHIRDLIDKK